MCNGHTLVDSYQSVGGGGRRWAAVGGWRRAKSGRGIVEGKKRPVVGGAQKAADGCARENGERRAADGRREILTFIITKRADLTTAFYQVSKWSKTLKKCFKV